MSSSNGYQETPTFLAMALQTEQQKKPPQLHQIPSTLHQCHVPFRLLMNFSMTIFLPTSKQAKSTNIQRLLPTCNNYKALGMMY